MKFISDTKTEDAIVLQNTLYTMACNATVSVFVTFANGYTINMVRIHSTIYIEVCKGSKYFNQRIVFEYKDGEVIDFVTTVAKAEGDFDVGFAYGSLTPKFTRQSARKEVIE